MESTIVDKIVVERMPNGIHVSVYHGDICIFEEIRHHTTDVRISDVNEHGGLYDHTEKPTSITIHI